MNFKNLREYIIFFSVLIIGLGLFFAISSFYGAFLSTYQPDFFKIINDILGYWTVWVLIFSIIVIFIGSWYTYDTIRKRRKFEEYINTDSKATFIKHLKDLEVISYKLGPRYQDIVKEKKQDWKIK
ncbi:MAG: DUF3198 domain-containing protein [Thermoplasmata archaeon]